eukprot:TRINITY_DN103075_c0_g1_i1.p1 TRINITY_DN103075_c0_g1~~TRINITY_DN103075_c0_g1_i1.p1  ORF type:complete len:155 (-),score=14.02 TRINITY_DN103075_c0_g1_i1:57-521(-)
MSPLDESCATEGQPKRDDDDIAETCSLKPDTGSASTSLSSIVCQEAGSSSSSSSRKRNKIPRDFKPGDIAFESKTRCPEFPGQEQCQNIGCSLRSKGAANHHAGTCWPCWFENQYQHRAEGATKYSMPCSKGADCPFCHEDHPRLARRSCKTSR